MRLTRPFIIALTTCLAGLFATANLAEAQTRNKRTAQSRPLTVQKRSFLDSGRVVPVGSESRYVSDTVNYQRTTDYYYARSRYGNETLPGRFDNPGRGGALFNF